MLLQEMFDEFAKKSPPTVMVQATMEFALSEDWINDLFERTAQSQYTRELTFSTMVDLIAPVVCGTHKSVRSAYHKSPTELAASLTAVYDKLKGIEPEVAAELTRQTTRRLADIIEAMPGGKRAPLLPGYHVRILDGNCLGATEHRIFELRQTAAGPLPGKSLVVLDPQRMLAVDVFPCEDGHAQERSLLHKVLATIKARELWIADRNFCTNGFLVGIARACGAFIIRLHQGLTYEECGPWRKIRSTATGFAFERAVRIDDGEGGWLELRLVRVNLATATRDGDDELYLLTNLPEAKADAGKVAELYRQRWLLETAFLHLTKSLRCEINTLGYPKAALFCFCVALLAYNILAVTRAALRAAWGEQQGDEEISVYYLADEIAGTHRGMMIALPAPIWKRFQQTTAAELAKELVVLARNLNLKTYRKSIRGPKKPPPPRASSPNKPHLSTKKLLDARILRD
jgi:IS4 transposase